MALVFRCFPGEAEAVPRKRTLGLKEFDFLVVSVGISEEVSVVVGTSKVETEALYSSSFAAKSTSSIVSLRISSTRKRQLSGFKLKPNSREGRKVYVSIVGQSE